MGLLPVKAYPAANRGFGLVEILVVLAILGVLVAIAIPVVDNALVAANRGKCVSNQRQIGLALQMYANEHEGRFPGTMHSTSYFRKEESWVFELAPYLGDVDKVRVCPADEPDRQQRILEGKFTSYVLNDQVFDDPRYNSPIKLPQPSKTILMFILSADRNPSQTWDHVHGGEWTSWAAALYDTEPDRHRSGERSDDRTKGSSNYLFADGHVENISAREFKGLFDQGINPAAVPTE